MAKIYVSSSFVDLQEQREAVNQTTSHSSHRGTVKVVQEPLAADGEHGNVRLVPRPVVQQRPGGVCRLRMRQGLTAVTM